MYRDDSDAAQLRIQTLEAKLAEQQAGLHARDAEIAELQAGLDRLGKAATPPSARRPLWPVAVGIACATLGLGGAMAVTVRPAVPREPLVLGMTGVPACDLYLARLETCTSISPSTQATMKEAFASQRKAMRDAAQTPEGRTALVTACGQGLQMLDTNGACRPQGSPAEPTPR